MPDAGPERRYTIDASWTDEGTLSDGTPVRFRMIRPEDKQLLLEGFHRLSPESRYRRFFSYKDTLNEAELKYLTEVDGVDHVAVGAMVTGPDGRDLGAGVARYIRTQDDPDVAEAAVAVIDDLHGKGLGRMLLERLMTAALERGITHFRCDVLASNDTMRALLQEVAPNAVVRDEGEVVVVEYPLPVDHGPVREWGFYRLLRQVAQGALRAAGLRNR
jgi:GNAT superfamily N-acetyltransferase